LKFFLAVAIFCNVLQEFPWPEPQSGAVGDGEMKAHLQVIFTLDELAAYLKVGKRTLYRLAAHREIPAFKVGGTWRFRQREIDQWINDQIQAGAKKEVMRSREQQKSSEQSASPGCTVRRSRQRA
jgi:excisionase family DNA binding protein